MGYVLGGGSVKAIGFTGSGVFWIAALLVGLPLALHFSWAVVAERLGAALEGVRHKRQERIERAEDIRLGEQALREREEVVQIEREQFDDHAPLVIEAPMIELPRSERVAKEKQKPLFSELADTKLPQVDLLDAAPGRMEIGRAHV